jgi:fumarate reductase subunit D
MMFKFDKNTVPYHISNMIFYVVTLAVVGLIYYFAFLPPLLEVTTDDFFATFGVGEFVGALFFLILIVVPILLIIGIVYHLMKLVKPNKNVPAEN